MTYNHTELCEILRAANYSMTDRAADLIEAQAARIKRQEIEYLSLQEIYDRRERHISDLKNSISEWREDFQHLSVHLAEIRAERDALKADAEGYRLIRSGAVYVEPQDSDGRVYVATSENGKYCKTADEFDVEISAALQAEKEAK